MDSKWVLVGTLRDLEDHYWVFVDSFIGLSGLVLSPSGLLIGTRGHLLGPIKLRFGPIGLLLGTR